MRKSFTHNGFTLEYVRFGEVKEVAIAFHGFGREAADFEGFDVAFGGRRSVVAVNLFAHGNSRLPRFRPVTESLTPNEWTEVFAAFLDHLGVQRAVLMGYSMGGRIALCTYDWMPDRIAGLLLMAPDGMKTNRLADFSTGTWAGRALQRSIMRWPGLLLRAADAAHRLTVIDRKLHRFVHVHMGTEASRLQVYSVWHIYRFFRPNRPRIARRIQETQLPFLMLFGRSDSVIPAALGQRFASRLGNDDALVVLDIGHQLMEEALEFLVRSEVLVKRFL